LRQSQSAAAACFFIIFKLNCHENTRTRLIQTFINVGAIEHCIARSRSRSYPPPWRVWSGCDQLCHPLGCQWLPSGNLGAGAIVVLPVIQIFFYIARSRLTEVGQQLFRYYDSGYGNHLQLCMSIEVFCCELRLQFISVFILSNDTSIENRKYDCTSHSPIVQNKSTICIHKEPIIEWHCQTSE